jgi:hypothetical protein
LIPGLTTFPLRPSMVWVSNYASVSTTVSVTKKTHCGGSDSEHTYYPKQNESYVTCHWSRHGDEIITIKWAGGKEKSFKIGKDAHVLIYDDAVGISTADFVSVR